MYWPGDGNAVDAMLLQVVVVALVLSFIVKRDSEVIDYEDAFGKMKTVDDVNLTGYKSMKVLITNHAHNVVK